MNQAYLKKEILKEYHNFIYKSDFEGTIDEVIERIKSIPERFKVAYPLNTDFLRNHRFSIRQDIEYDYGDSDYHDVYILQAYRWETDQELEIRLQTNEKKSQAAKQRELTKQEAKIKREKTIYENLKKKFEKP